MKKEMTTQERNALIDAINLTPATYLTPDEARLFSLIGFKLRRGKTPTDSELLRVAKCVPMGVTSSAPLPVKDMILILEAIKRTNAE